LFYFISRAAPTSQVVTESTGHRARVDAWLLTLQEHQAGMYHLIALRKHLLPLPEEDGDCADDD
jgi:5-hydroxyisourate hydrolase-like protein (transthyretin family)